MRGVRGVKPDRRGSDSWVAVFSDPFKKRQRRFHFKSEAEATAKKISTTAKIKAIQEGHFTVPPNVTDIVLWLVKEGKEGVASKNQKPTTIGDLVDAYLVRQKERAELGGDEGISLGRYQSEEYHLKIFQEFCESNDINSVEQALGAENLEQYKLYVSKRFPSRYTVRDATYSVKMMITWAWETRRIEDMPRNLKSFRRVSVPDPEVKIFSKEEVKELYQRGSSRMKLYLLLALNAGYTQKDIADLRHENIDWKVGAINEIRGKVAKKAIVQRRVKLWPSTLRQLKLHATDPDISDRVLLSEDGNILVRRSTIDGKSLIIDCVRSTFYRARNKCSITGRSFKHFRKTGADLIKNRYDGGKTKTNAELFDMYLAHKPEKMVRPYDPGDWTEIHEATDWLGVFLGLYEGGNLDGSG